MAAGSYSAAASDEGGAVDFVSTVWRYRWAAIIPAFLGAIAGFVLYLKTPETYQASTKLMFESNRPAVFDNVTGDVIGGVPPIEILRSQLFSDRVMLDAASSELLAAYIARTGGSKSSITEESFASLALNTDFSDTQNLTSLVTSLSFTNTDAELCEAAVKAYSQGLQKYFSEKHRSNRGELVRLIGDATDRLQT